MRGDFDQAEQLLADYAAHLDTTSTVSPAERASYSALCEYRQASLATLRGHLSVAERLLRKGLSRTGEQAPNFIFGNAIQLALIDVWHRDNSVAGVSTLDGVLKQHLLESFEPLNRPYIPLAQSYAIAGQAEKARALLADYEAVVNPIDLEDKPQHDPYYGSQRWLARGLIALSEGRVAESIREFESGEYGAFWYTVLPWRARAYDISARPDTAIALYERYLNYCEICKFRQALTENCGQTVDAIFWLPVVYERLGDLYEQRGDTVKAILYHGKLVDLWKDADPELQPRVEAARRAIEALSPDT